MKKKVDMLLKARVKRQDLMAVFVLLFSTVSLGSMLLPGIAFADQILERSITMSDSAPSGTTPINGSTVGSGAGVTYSVKFDSQTAGVIEGIVVSFCNNSPFIGDTDGCTAIPGFSVTGATATTVASLDPSLSASTPSSHIFKYMSETATTPTAAGATVEFSISGIVNPSETNHPFYARIMTYSDADAADDYTDLTPGNYVDYGAVALSTASVIQITAKVQETLIFCVSGDNDPDTFDNPLTPANPLTTTGGCNPVGADGADADTDPDPVPLPAPAMIIGHGENNTLDASQVDRGEAFSLVSTNAASGVGIRLRNSNLCGGLSRLDITDQTNTTGCDIPPVNWGGPSAPIVAGTAAFGVHVSDGIIVNNGTGAVTPVAEYTGADTTFVGMNNTSPTVGVSSTYGDLVAASTGPVSSINNIYTFAATASNTTPAGLYRANVALIATGTY